MNGKVKNTVLWLILSVLTMNLIAGCAYKMQEPGANPSEVSEKAEDTEQTDKPDIIQQEEKEPETTEAELKEGDQEPDMAEAPEETDAEIVFGDERLDVFMPLLKDKRVALFSNQTGIVKDETILQVEIQGADEGLTPLAKSLDEIDTMHAEHILDIMVENGINVTMVLSPEHGFRGNADAGEKINDSVDEKTGVPIVSLYGESKVPSQENIDKFDTLVVDIQDVGLRYYTYYVTMYYLMDICAANDKSVIILDRPNPNGYYVDGPILEDGYKSFVGQLPIPVVHGLTLGELAGMINGEGWLEAGRDACDLTVIPCENYTHKDKIPILMRPSPNLKDMRSVYLYASTCFFENTVISVGRGTDFPFEAFGSPYLEGALPFDFTFIPETNESSKNPPFEGQKCFGRDLRGIPLETIINEGINLTYLIDAYNSVKEIHPEVDFFGSPDKTGRYWIDMLSGSDDLRTQIVDGKSAEEIKASWQDDIDKFIIQRAPYLLYEDID